MNAFATPQWESNPAADKTCKELFKKTSDQKRKFKESKKNKSETVSKKNKPKIKRGRIEKDKSKKHLKNKLKNIDKAELANSVGRNKRDHSHSFNQNNTKRIKYDQSELIENKLKVKKQKKKPKFKNNYISDDVPNVTTSGKSFNGNSQKKIKRGRSEFIENKVKAKQEKRKLKLPSNTAFDGGPEIDDTSALVEDGINNRQSKKQKNKITHQTLFLQSSRRSRSKLNKINAHSKTGTHDNFGKADENKTIAKKKKKKNKSSEAEEIPTSNESKSQNRPEKIFAMIPSNRKQNASLSLRERMLAKLKGARFRYLNEQMYTSTGKDAKKYFESDPNAYTAYHVGYQHQVARWPINPVDIIIQKIKKLPRTHIIADFGCGEAKLAESVPQEVHSFDLIAVNERVTACDMAHVPLENSSVDVAVFCLSLMGTNLTDYLMEANRILKIGGMLKIAEVESRFENVDAFMKDVQSLGFSKGGKDLSHNLFFFLGFTKKDSVSKSKNKKLPIISLNPCLYKKR